MSEELVERVAISMYTITRTWGRPQQVWDVAPKDYQKWYRDMARAAITTIMQEAEEQK